MATSDHFALEAQRLLKAHGFERWPTEEELLRYLFKVEDKIDVLADMLGYRIAPDVRGRLKVWFINGGDRRGC